MGLPQHETSNEAIGESPAVSADAQAGVPVAQLLPGSGVVVRQPPLTAVLAPAVGDGTAEAIRLIALVDQLIASHPDGLDFAPVAAGLQDLVVAFQPLGVAAVLDLAPEPILFVFDQAEITDAQATHRGRGRSGWNTGFVDGDRVTLSVSESTAASPTSWQHFTSGAVAAGGVLIPIVAADRAAAVPPPRGVPAPVPAAERERPAGPPSRPDPQTAPPATADRAVVIGARPQPRSTPGTTIESTDHGHEALAG